PYFLSVVQSWRRLVVTDTLNAAPSRPQRSNEPHHDCGTDTHQDQCQCHANANATWLSDRKLSVETVYPSNSVHAVAAPMRPPINVRAVASTRTEQTIGTPPNPIARSVPISFVRDATAVYIVFMAP